MRAFIEMPSGRYFNCIEAYRVGPQNKKRQGNDST